ncbi:MAG: hypothetical protein HC773_03220 [Scytonema sp. CRU_2_7]|nr:hypothetical protein [Scytonema sp. CRU_2_7]
MGIFTTVANKVGYGGDDNSENKRTYMGDHAVNKDQVLAATDGKVINPLQPGNWHSIRSEEVVETPRYYTKEEADSLKSTAKTKTDGARHTKRAYKSLEKIENADTTVHKSHRRYQKTVAGCETQKLRSNASLARKLHHLRPEYVQMGKGIDNAESKADTRITELRAKVGASM